MFNIFIVLSYENLKDIKQIELSYANAKKI